MLKSGKTLSKIFTCILTCLLFTVGTIAQSDAETTEKTRGQHAYGGWNCPDNLGGFPPVDIKDLDKISVITDRLPTKEETWDGRSLIFVDLDKHPDARALDITLPRLARIHSRYTGLDELIIVIQAIIVEGDSVVGYRYPNGGNGSAWLDQVEFLSNEEIEKLGSMPFVFRKVEIQAGKEEIWDAIRVSSYADRLAEEFDQGDFFKSEWTQNSKAHLNYDENSKSARGIIMNFWGNIYLQIDYQLLGFHSTEKLMISEDSETKTSHLWLVAGPYPNDHDKHEKEWNAWIEKIKENL